MTNLMILILYHECSYFFYIILVKVQIDREARIANAVASVKAIEPFSSQI